MSSERDTPVAFLHPAPASRMMRKPNRYGIGPSCSTYPACGCSAFRGSVPARCPSKSQSQPEHPAKRSPRELPAAVTAAIMPGDFRASQRPPPQTRSRVRSGPSRAASRARAGQMDHSALAHIGILVRKSAPSGHRGDPVSSAQAGGHHGSE